MMLAISNEVPIPGLGHSPDSVHIFDEVSKWAVRAAIAANRPLLVRGEPGVGKSQLARAAAIALNRTFLSVVVTARTEAQDLLYTFDAVQRLALAQICAALQAADVRDLLKESRFIHPGPLWWAFDWLSAERAAKRVRAPIPAVPDQWVAGSGCVLLIDEIDKAESDVPNGLLEALGSYSFPVRGRKLPIALLGEAPLVIITTNEDRVLPNAFVRRCLVLHLRLPAEDDLPAFLMQRGRVHQPNMSDELLDSAASLLLTARREHIDVRPRPGQAEYLDLLRAVAEIIRRDPDTDPVEALENMEDFAFRKTARTSS